MNCDFCGVPVSEDDTFIVLPDEIVDAARNGYVPECLSDLWTQRMQKQGMTDAADIQAAIEKQWQQLVADNAAVDWLLCPGCHLELVQFRKGS